MILLTCMNTIWIMIVTFTFTSLASISYNYINRLKILNLKYVILANLFENIALFIVVILGYKRFITSDSTFDTKMPYIQFIIIAIIFSIINYYLYETPDTKSTLMLGSSQVIILVVWMASSDLARDTLVDYSTAKLFNVWAIAAIVPLIISIFIMHRDNWLIAEDSKELILYDIVKTLLLFIITMYSSINLTKNHGLSRVDAAQFITVITASLVFMDYLVYKKIYQVRYIGKALVQYSSYIVAAIILTIAFAIKA